MNTTDDERKEDAQPNTTRSEPAQSTSESTPKSTSVQSTSKSTSAQNSPESTSESAERLQKLISRAGIASRRAAERLIVEGKVAVNGKTVTELGAKADPQKDKIIVEGRPLVFSDAAPTVVLMHKPRGYITSKHDPEGRETVLDLLPKKLQHLNPVGRLDYDTSGVLLLTDDGDLLHALTHPSRGVEKVYHARVGGQVLPGAIEKLESGVEIVEDQRRVRTAPCRARVRAQTANNALVEIALREGRNRQVRKMLEAVGHRVSSLRRIRFAGLELEELSVGEHRVLLPGEVHALRKRAEKRVRPRRASTSSEKSTSSGKSTLPSKPRGAGGGSERSDTRKSVAGGSKTTGRPARKKSSAPESLPLGERIRRKWK